MSETLYPYLLFWTFGLVCFSAEWLFPARDVAYRSVILNDLIATGLYFLFFNVAVYLTDHIPVIQYQPQWLHEQSSIGKLICFYLVEDFGLYWIHRLMHTKPIWRVHKWHHSPFLSVLACRLAGDPPSHYPVQSQFYCSASPSAGSGPLGVPIYHC